MRMEKTDQRSEQSRRVAAAVRALKGYGLGLIDELYAGYIGGSLPQIRGNGKLAAAKAEKRGSTFYFQVSSIPTR